MVQTILIAIVAGLAAALLFLAPASGSILAFPLFALTGLPIAIAGLGWGVVAGVIAAGAGGAVILALFPDNLTSAVFIVLFGVPIVWLTHLAGLSRTDAEGAREWYRLGRVLLHASIAVAVALIVVGIITAYDPEAMVKEATAALGTWLTDAQTDNPPTTAAEIEPIMRVYVAFMPCMIAMLMTAITVLDMWLGSLVARASNRLQRPSERLWTVVLPNEILIGFGVAVVLAFLPAPFGTVALVFAGAFGAALVLIGLAVLHALTLGMSGRVALLIVAYAFLIFSGLPIVLFALLGAGETFLQLRARRFRQSSTPD